MKRSGFSPKPYEEVIAEAVRKQLAKLEAKKNESAKPPKSTFKPRKKAIKGKLGRVKGKKKVKLTTLKNKLWAVVSKRIRERDKYICFTSGKKVEGSNAHCGHGTPSSVCGGRLRYHPKNLHCQSYNENINLGGNGRVYYQKQIERYGKETVDKLDSLQHKFIKVDDVFYGTLLDLYKNGTWEEIEQFLEN